ncbi:hypothetical protein V6K52_19125 [Knoellia sp. S7-12]|uniref:hypothetical protein n=1 Tax=Knoellia sp. S7-12 TaxID=3126698 RepID=UPI0033677F62
MPDDKNIERSLRLRSELPKLLAQNPNHFGNLKDTKFTPQLEIVQDTVFEEITCLGFNPDTDDLEATIQIKRPNGYGGDLCSPGSTEWVRFYLSYDDGATWEDVGLGSFNAHDVPDSVDCHKDKTKPLVYTVAFPLNDQKRQRCSRPVLPLVRAILSWQVQPPASQPGYNPIWGNAIDRHIQLRPSRRLFVDFVEDFEIDLKKIPDWYESVLPLPIPEPDPAPFSLVHAAKVARADKIPAHRFAAPLLASTQQSGFQDQSVLLANADELKLLKIDLGDLVGAFNDNKEDTTYEQISCLGLDYNRDLLVSTLQIKLPSGFSGPPCSAGSVEYVAFWVDYDNTCDWTYLDTAKVAVHDYPKLPSDGLNYWVGVPAQTAKHADSCKEPKVGRIRAVLSWGTPPSTTDPFDRPRWGNAIETHIEIPSRRRPPTDSPDIRALGRIPVESIDTLATGLTQPGALFIEHGSPADSLGRACPFGGVVTVHAYANDAFAAAGRQYRAMWRPSGSSSIGTPVTGSFVTGFFPVVTRTPDPTTGFTPYLSTALNPFGQLAAWQTRGVVVDGLYEIRLEMVDSALSPVGATDWHTIRVDNTKPDANITFTSGTSCNRANPGDLVQGTFTATDPFFGSYSLNTLPASLIPPATHPTHIPVSTTSPVASGTWQLPTTVDWLQCGYVVQLHVYDRSIVDSVPWSKNYGYDDIGFCLGL